jgi:PAS domain S-box-containing protein
MSNGFHVSTADGLTHTVLGNLAELSNDIFWMYDNHNKTRIWFASKENRLKYQIPDTVSFGIPEDYEAFIHTLDTTRFERRLSHEGADHKQYLIEEKIKINRGTDQRATQILGVWRDITADADRHETIVPNERDTNSSQHQLLLTEELNQTHQQLLANYHQLLEREHLLSLTQRLTKIGSWEYEYSSQKFQWSEEMYNIFGVDKNTDIQDFDFHLALYEENSKELITHVYQQLIAGITKNFDVTVQIITPLGYKKWLRVVGESLENQKYSERAVGVTYDITYFKESEARLKASKEGFSKAFNNNPDPMMIIRKSDMVIMNANKKVIPVLEYTPNELIGRNILEAGLFTSPTEWLPEISGDDDYKEFEAVWYKKSGIRINALISGSVAEIQGEQNYIVVIKDITERKEAEEKLRRSEANIKATINNTSVMVWSVDRDLRYVMMNNPFLDYVKTNYGFSMEPGMLISPETGDANALALHRSWEEYYKRALSGETFNVTEERCGLILAYSFNPIIENNKLIGVSVFAEDVTQKIAQQNELAAARQALAEYKLMALRSAMNPHFIFNALNSIQYFITERDRANAINYLSTFSKLIRGILNNSKSNAIRLHEELTLLKHYINLELLRFENKFEFILDIEDDLDIYSLEIQPLIIQPFVENAIIHGLYNSYSKGILRISIRKQNPGTLFVIIEDNGIGREAARKLREKNFPSHTSVGISITEERLRIMSKDLPIHIEDLVDENGVAAGTRVTLSLTL